MNTFLIALKGMAMGIAEVIPGVSGGTIAFITGIYERLLNVIKSIGPDLLKEWKQDGFSGIWKAIDGNFIITLVAGMAVGVIVGVFGISHLLETYPVVLWAFFFGLIIASAIYIAKQVTNWRLLEIVLLIIGITVAYGITVISPVQGNEALWFVFISGAIAISALILPGISGSFILLLLGMYTFIVPTVKQFLSTFDMASLSVVIVFGLGCLTGLALFSRVLSWTFKHYKNPTLALLTGFMLGSLNKIWPWRNPIEWLKDKQTGEYVLNDEGLRKVLVEQNVSPSNYEALTGNEAMFVPAIIAAVVGFIAVFILEKLGK